MKKLTSVFLQTLVLAAMLAVFSTGASVASSTPSRTIPAVQNKQDKQEETVYITNTGKKYHRDGCRYLSSAKIAIKRKDAIASGMWRARFVPAVGKLESLALWPGGKECDDGGVWTLSR